MAVWAAEMGLSNQMDQSSSTEMVPVVGKLAVPIPSYNTGSLWPTLAAANMANTSCWQTRQQKNLRVISNNSFSKPQLGLAIGNWHNQFSNDDVIKRLKGISIFTCHLILF
jgi:hypothetical protein